VRGYKTEVVVAKDGGGGLFGMFGGKKAAIKLNFEDQSEGPLTRVHRSIGLEKLSAGQVLARGHGHRLQRKPAAVEGTRSSQGITAEDGDGRRETGDGKEQGRGNRQRFSGRIVPLEQL
jgi:hypothetical protein